MNLKIEISIILFVSLFSIVPISADTTITNFYNSTNDSLGATTNITFDQSESKFVYLQVPKNSTVINASMNVSGYEFISYQFQNNETDNLEDSFVSEISPTNNYGTLTYLLTDSINVDERQIYLKFSLNKIPSSAKITDATLFLYKYAGSGILYTRPESVYNSSNQTWDENIINWNNRPSADVLIDTVTIDRIIHGWIAWNVTNAVNYSHEISDSNITLIIIAGDTSGNTKISNYYSKEYSDTTLRPYLNITYRRPPTNLSLDIGNNSNTDWSMTGELNSSNSPKNITLNITAIQNYVDTNNASADGYVYVPLNFTSDIAGIVQVDTLSMYIDFPPYNFTFTRANNSNLSQDYFYVNVTYTDTGPDTCLLDVNQTGNQTMSGVGTTTCNYSVTGLSDGTYNYTVYINDTNGKTSSSGMFFVTLDVTKPAIVNQTTSATKGENFTLNADITDALTGIKNASGNITFAGVVIRDFNLTEGSENTWSVAIVGIDSEGNYNLSITAYDFAGNSRTTVSLFSIPVGQEGGGGGGGGGGTPSLIWCPKESKFILAGQYTDEKCLEDFFVELKAKNATIVYFGQKNIGFFPSKITCQPFFGTKSGCRSIFILANKTTYVMGVVWSTVGVIEQRDYTWSITGVGVEKIYTTPEFEVIFGNVGNYTLSLTVNDSIGMVYTKSHDFEVLEVLAEEVADNETDGGVIPGKPTIVGVVWGAVKTFGGKVKAAIPMLPKRIVNWGIDNKWFLGTISLVGIIGGGFVYSQKRGF